MSENPDIPSSARYALWAIAACVIWSTAFPAVKIGLRSLSPLTFAGWRFMLAGLLLMPLCGSPRKYLATVLAHWRVVLSVSILQTTILYGLFFIALQVVPGAKAAIIIGSSPLVCALMAHRLMPDDRMSWGKAGAVLLGIVGVVVLAIGTKPWEGDRSHLHELLGMALLMVGVFSSALAGIVVARQMLPVRPMLLNSAQMGLGGLTLTVIALFVEGPPTAAPPANFYLALVWLSAVSAIGVSIWFALLRRVKVSYLNMWKFLIPVFGAVLSWSLLPEESPTAAGVTGMVCVAAAVLLTQWQANRKARRVDRA